MTSFPETVERYLRSQTFDARHPLCIEVDADNRLVDRWGEAEHYDLAALLPGHDVSTAIPFLDAGSGGDVVELPFIADAAGHTFHAHLLPTEHGRYVLYLDAREEFAQRQRTQQAANEVKLLLERERRFIAELTDAKAELTVRRKEAEEQSRRRGEYIATMSHEFRTPLAALLAHADKLTATALQTDVMRAGDAIRRIARQSLWLVDNLLTNARLEADGFAIYETVADPRVLADDLSIVFAPLAAEKGLSFAAFVTEQVPRFVRVDDLHVRQILVNLLGNAIKYTDTGAVSVEIDFLDNRLRAVVADTGCGIAAEERQRLFRPFQRGRHAPRTLGAGLGLSITKALVEAMDGVLRLESDVGVGTRVSVELPAQAITPEPPVADGGRERAAVLVGEDDPDLAELIALRLGEAGYAVEVVADGEAVLDRALASQPQLVIVDTNMPKLDGPSAARALRERGFGAPILALSAASRSSDIERALASGCTDFLRKPAHPDVLKRVVAQLIAGSRSKT
jgi:signal transduction histidine kinase/CheY-like chemotaxis protein